MRLSRRQPLLVGLLLVFAGVIVLIVNFDLLHLQFDLFGVFWWIFWPLALILPGLRLVIRQTAWFASLAALLVLVAFWSVSFAPANIRTYLREGANNQLATQQLQEPLQEGVDKLHLNLRLNGETITLHSTDSTTEAYQAHMQNMGRLNEKIVRSGNELQVTLSRAAGGTWYRNSRINGRADLAVTSAVPVMAEIRSDATSEKLNFSDIQLTHLLFKTDALESTITFGSKVPVVTADLDTEDGMLVLRVPKHAGLAIVINADEDDNGTGNLEQMGLVRSGNEYNLAPADAAAPSLTLKVKLESGSVRLERY